MEDVSRAGGETAGWSPEGRGSGPGSRLPLGDRRFFTRAWRPGQRGPRRRPPARGGGEVSGLRLPQRHPAVPTCSRRFCQRPHGLSSRMSLSSSLSSSRSRSRPRLGAGSGAAMALSVRAAALRAIRRGRRSPPAPAPRTGAQPGAEPPRPRSPTPGCGNWAAQARGRGVDLARRSGAASSGGRWSGASPQEPSPRGDRRRPRPLAPTAPPGPSPQPGSALNIKPRPVHGPTHDLGPASEQPPCSSLGPTYPRLRPRPQSSALLSPAQRRPPSPQPRPT